MVMNVMVKRRDIDCVMWGLERRAKANRWIKHRNGTTDDTKTETGSRFGKSTEGACLLAVRCPVQRRRESNLGFRTELENLVGDVKGEGASGRTVRPRVPMRQRGADCPVLAVKWSNAHGAKGAGHSSHAHLVNQQWEEPKGCDGGRQLSMDGTSRVSREAQARICERLGVRFPGATRPRGETPRGYSAVR
jgi:hypothetical protein